MIYIIFCFVIPILADILGIILKSYLVESLPLTISLLVLALLPIPILAANIIATSVYTKRIKGEKVDSFQRYLLEHREKAKSESHKGLSQLKRIRYLTNAYSVLLVLCAISAAVLSSAFIGATECFPLLIYSFLIMYAVQRRIKKREKEEDNSDNFAKPEDYPNLHALAKRAASAVGCETKEIRIFFTSSFNVSISKTKSYYILFLGAMVLDNLTEEELYNTLLHEFSHVSDKYKKINKERDYYCFITSIDDILNFASKIAAKLYLFSDIFLFIRYTVFDYATTLMIETDADEAMAKYGDPKIAASMLIKFSYHDRFQWEDGSYDSEPLYADEEPPKNSVRNESMKLKKAIEEKSELWNDLASREILANNSTHPTVKMRISALGIEEIKTVHSSSSEAYLDEKEKALDMIDSIIYDSISKNYEEIRRDNYIEPLERITQWEGEGSPLRGETYADIISDLRALGRCKDAEALCDRAIAELPAASAHSAHFFKGAFLLHRYDASGIDHVYKAIEENMNYCDEGLDMIGSFCCITGREKELAEYREKAVVIAQKNYDEDINAGELNKKDDLRGESLPEGMLEDILGYIATIDEGIIDKIYLVRKTISESFFTSAFVVGFSCKDAKKIHGVMHKIFLYLDAHPSGWQFSLFELSEHKDIDFEKIEGSLVYTADKKED